MIQLQELTLLVTRAQNGDRDAYGELAELMRPSVYAMLLSRLRDPHEAQELTQDVLLHALVKLGQLRHPAAFPSWLRRIAVRMVINRVTRQAPDAAIDPEVFEATPANDVSPIDRLIDDEEAARLHEGLDRLRPSDRETLVAFYFQGQSIEQMSVQTAAPIGTIKRRLHVARNRLRAELESQEHAPRTQPSPRRRRELVEV
jgi:RNA polymerase sigma-70 factor (ECF subfamily)